MTAAQRKTPTQANGGTDDGVLYTNLVDAEIEALWKGAAFGYLTGIGGSANAITAASDTALVIAIAAYARPMAFWLPVGTTNTGAVTLNIDSIGVVSILDRFGSVLQGGELAAGAVYPIVFDGANFRAVTRLGGQPDISASTLLKALIADDTGGLNVNTAQPWFPTAGGVTVLGSTAYEFEGQLHLSRAAGTTSHTTSILFGGTATLTSIAYMGTCKTGDANDLQNIQGFRAVAATALAVKAASTSATEQSLIMVRGIIRINAGGTLIPQFQYSAAPGGTPTIKANSFFKLTPLGNNSVASIGAWA